MNTFKKPFNSILACEFNNIIGHGTKIPWHLTDDFKLFKFKTDDCDVVMGRITAQTFKKPLPNRNNIVITKNTNLLLPEGFTVVHSLESALCIAEKSPRKMVWNIGGGTIYELAQREFPPKEIHITRIQANYRSENEIKFYGFPANDYFLDHSRTVDFKRRDAMADGQSVDKGNTDDAIVEIYVRKY